MHNYQSQMPPPPVFRNHQHHRNLQSTSNYLQPHNSTTAIAAVAASTNAVAILSATQHSHNTQQHQHHLQQSHQSHHHNHQNAQHHHSTVNPSILPTSQSQSSTVQPVLLQPLINNSLAIRQEIQRFESVHPSIYAIYDLIDLLPITDAQIAQQIRDHVVCIEGN